MISRVRAVPALVALSGIAAGAAGSGPVEGQSLESDASTFWLASDAAERAAAAERLAGADVPLDDLLRALAAVPAFPEDIERGRLDRVRRNADGRPHPYTVLVPDGYTPDRDWPVLVYLHGGVGRPAFTSPGEWWRDYERIADPRRIVIVPASWNESRWWQASQIENLTSILRELGREYRIDRNRVHMIGISDGGSGAYYHAFRAAGDWASFLAFIGHPAVLSNPGLGVDGQMYVTNLRNRPFMAVNGGRDRLYSTASVEPFMRLFREHGVRMLYRPKPAAGHDLSWMPEEAARIDSFIIATPRDPLPDRLEWETETPGESAGAGRFAWIVIDSIGDVPDQADLPDRNSLTVDGEADRYLAFPHPRPSGRVEAERSGNVVRVATEGVSRFRVLVSPDEFDLDRPIRVVANGAVEFDGRVDVSTETLLEWAARDGDREALFVAVIPLDLRR